MKVKYLFFSVMLFFILSCSNNADRDIIAPDKMADILFDISLAEGYVETFVLKDTSLLKDSVFQKEINKVLQIHGTTPSSFSESYRYYIQRPLIFKEIMDSTNARAMRRKEDAIRIDNKKLIK